MKEILKKLKEKKNIIVGIIIAILIALFSFSVAPKTLQNDTFYTVSIGNLIMENGIDMKDHFSWHKDLPYTYPHWLYDVFMSIIYNIGSWKGIYLSVCIMSIILGFSIYIVNKKLNKNQIISFAVTIGAMYLLKDYIAARAQLLTFIIYVWVIYFIEKFIENPKKIQYAIGIILSSILIANLHVAVWPFIFIIALPYIAEYIISLIAEVVVYRKGTIAYKKHVIKKCKNEEKVKKAQEELDKIYESNEKIKKVIEEEEPYKIRMKLNKNVKWLILVMAICALTGFLTPLGTTPYTYLIKTMQGNTVNNINEHLPLTLIKNIPIMCTIVIVLSLVTFTKVKIRLSDLFMIGGLTYLMFSSKRQSTMFVIIGSIILNRMTTEAIKIYSKDKIDIVIKQIIAVIGILVAILAVIYGLKFIDKKKNNSYVSESSYPVKAADWILENLDVKNIKLFNEYNYGSYLLYRGIPVFIDSRADLYAPEFNGKQDIFMDFINTSNLGEYYGNTFEKYGITHVILYKNAKVRMIIDETEPENYNKIYSDNNFVIYEIVK
jgi:hypothetical protein